jgi:adenosylmethionine-8-amino-7-oxononanoate aminotransferase
LDAESIARLEAADRTHLWKPFTQMAGYVQETPIVMQEGRGAWLLDVRGRAFLDGVSSLWVNLHGHAHPTIQARISAQLAALDHSTLLGPTNVTAVELAERLIQIAPSPHLTRVFYSDSGSTAVEIAVKMAFQYFAQHREGSERRRNTFVCLTNAYHGDTLGSVSVGGIELFHALYEPLLFKTVLAPAPDPYHRAFGEDVAEHEAACLTRMRELFDQLEGRVAALIMEPLVQGAAGMLRHTADYLRGAAAIAREHGALVILDEVATGFGRSGTMFACEQAGVEPDLMCLAKGITGGVLPLAATLATERIYEGFLGEHSEYRTFFHGHSYTGNPLACAAALGSLDVFEEERTLSRLEPRIAQLAERLAVIEEHPHVGSVRRLGTMTGIELVQDKRTGEPFEASRLVGRRVVEAALERGVLIRPLGDVVVLMPPLSITEDELDLLTGVALSCIDAVTRSLA